MNDKIKTLKGFAHEVDDMTRGLRQRDWGADSWENYRAWAADWFLRLGCWLTGWRYPFAVE